MNVTRKYYPLVEATSEEGARKIAEKFGTAYVYTGNPKPWLVIGTKEQIVEFEDYMAYN